MKIALSLMISRCAGIYGSATQYISSLGLFDVYSHLFRTYFIAVKHNFDDLFMYIIALHQLF